MKIIPLLLCATALACLSGCTRTKISSEANPNYAFDRIATYQWIDAPADLLERHDALLGEEMKKALNNELAARAWRQVPDAADATVQASCLFTTATHTEHAGNAPEREGGFAGGLAYDPRNGQWNYAELEPNEIAYAIEIGTLDLTIRDTATGVIAWRGRAECEIDRTRPEQERQEQFRQIARKLFDRFPRKGIPLNLPQVLIALLAAAIVAAAMMHRRKTRRLRLLRTPPPESWKPILDRNLPMVAWLGEEPRRRLFGAMQLFLAEKRFEGCGGLEITEEIKVAIAAQACLLLAGREITAVYPRLKSILVYPRTYRTGRRGLFGGEEEEEEMRLGESWECGVVVLSWDDVVRGARYRADGNNVVYHEFAHQLDQEDGAADGLPILRQAEAYAAWARVFKLEFEELSEGTRRGWKSTLDPYGATDPAEFFAVATETFFEKPRRLRALHPELYAALQAYYNLDPAEWERAPARTAR